APKITQLSCRRRCDRRTAFWRRARRSPSAPANPAPSGAVVDPACDHDGQRIPSKYDAYLGTELIVRASATPPARALARFSRANRVECRAFFEVPLMSHRDRTVWLGM